MKGDIDLRPECGLHFRPVTLTWWKDILVLRLFGILLVAAALVSGCGGGSTTLEPTPDPSALLTTVISNIRQMKTFRMVLEQNGAEYPFKISLDAAGGSVNAVLRRAEAQFVAPDVLYAQVTLKVSVATIGIDIFARGSNQWLRLPPAPWLNIPFAESFNPFDILAPDSGFQAALSTLESLEFIGDETLDDGTPVYHLRGTANGQSVKDLLVGLLDSVNDVTVDAYIAKDTSLPALLTITQPGTATDTQPDTNWRVEVYDYNAEPQIDDPEKGNP